MEASCSSFICSSTEMFRKGLSIHYQKKELHIMKKHCVHLLCVQKA